MNEYNIGYLACGNIVALSIACVFYMCGGRRGKWLRRYVGSFVIALSVNVTALLLAVWSPLLLIVYGFKIGEFSIGYSDNEGWGWTKRLMISALSVTCGALLCYVFGGGWWLLAIHGVVGVGTVVFAFRNPIPAAAEEVMVCLLNNAIIMFYPFIMGA